MSISIINSDERMNFLPSLFSGVQMRIQDSNADSGFRYSTGLEAGIIFESHVYYFADKLCQTYKSGYWEFARANGLPFMFPNAEQTFVTNSPGLEIDVELSNQAFGLAMTLFALGRLMGALTNEEGILESEPALNLCNIYHGLRMYSAEHPEGSNILAVID